MVCWPQRAQPLWGFVYFNTEGLLNDLDEKYLEEYLWLAAKLEEYVIHGVFRDRMTYQITEREGEKIFQLGRFQADIPGLFYKHLKHIEVPDMALDKVILFKDRGHVIPTDTIATLCAEYNKYSVRCVVMDGEICIQRDTVPPKADILAAEFETFKDNFELIVLGKGDVKEPDLQPFVVTTNDGKMEVVAFLQGNPNQIPTIVTKVVKIRKGADNFDEFWKDLDDSGEVIQKLLDPESCVIFFAPFVSDEDANDKDYAGSLEFPRTFAHNYEWGAVYSVPAATGGGEEVQEDTKPTPSDAPKVKGFQSMSPKAVAAAATVPPIAASTTRNLFVFGGGQHPAGVPVVKIAKNEISKLRPELRNRMNDSGALQFKEKEAWAHLAVGFHKDEAHRIYMEYLGFIPTNWKQDSGSKTPPLFPVSFLNKAVNISPSAPATDTAAAALATAKDVDTKYIPPSQKADDGELSDLKSELVTITKAYTKEIEDPDVMFKEDEKFFSAFWEKLEKTIAWPGLPWLGRVKICRHSPDNAARLWGGFQIICNNLRRRVKELEDRVAELELEAEAAAAAAKQTPTQPKKAFGSMK